MVNIKFGSLYFLPRKMFSAFFYTSVMKWKMDINTDINETIMERYHISLTWLDIKRLQFPLNPEDKRIIAEATSSRTEEFTTG